MRRFLIWLSGARQEILALSPGDRAKYEGVGSAILVTSSLAGISMLFALRTALELPVVVAFAGGALWGVAIMSLDRWLVVSIQRRTRWWVNIVAALPRLFLALLFGVVISTPLVLQIFDQEIDSKIVQIRQHDLDAFQKQQQNGDVGKESSRLLTLRNSLQNIISTNGDVPQDPDQDPRIIALKKQLVDARATSATALKNWDCQLYGPDCKPAGPGPLADAAEQTYRTSQRQIKKLDDQIEARKRDLTATDENSRSKRVADARKDLPAVEKDLKAVTDRQAALQRTFDDKNGTTGGLLLRLKALDEVSAENSTLGTARLVLFLFITSIEILPVLVKLMMSFGPENNYEKLSAIDAAEGLVTGQDAIIRRGRQQEDAAVRGIEAIWEENDAPSPRTRPLPYDPPRPPEEQIPTAFESVPAPPQMPDLMEDTQLRNMEAVRDVDSFGGDFDLPSQDPWGDADVPPPGPGPSGWGPPEPPVMSPSRRAHDQGSPVVVEDDLGFGDED